MAAVSRVAGTPIASGDYIPVGIVAGDLGDVSAATEYTEDAAAAANPTGSMTVARRRDTLGSETSADGDVVALNATDRGELYVKHSDEVDVANAGIDTLAGTVSGGTVAVTQAALDRTVDNAGVALQTDVLMNDTTALTPKFAVIDAATSGDNTLVTAVASKKIRVLSVFLVAAGAVTVRFESGAGGTALTGQMNVAANGGFVLPFSPLGHFETASNTLLNLELSGATSVDGCLTYVEV